MIEKPGIYRIDASTYHADPVAVPSLSSSLARTIIERSPLHAWTDHPRLNQAFKSEERKEYDRGSAAHALLIEGEDRIEIIAADSYRTKAAQEARDAARAAGKHPILAAEFENIYWMRSVALAAIRNCPDLSGLTLADGKAEESLIWQDGNAWCRARPDWHADDWSLVIDYKTTNASAHPDAWVRTMTGQGGEVQAAFYLRGIEALTKHQPKWVFLVQEVEAPFACSLIGLPPAFLALGESKVATAIHLWRECVASNIWPCYPNRICWVESPAWHQARWEESEGAHGLAYDPAALWSKPGPGGFDAEQAPL